ncbi:MAG TPA: hypothetical protein VGH20_09260 [Myxococcales bacterium]|jgi:hypothetical protein
MASPEEERRQARRAWTTTVFHGNEAEASADVEFWLSLSAEERIELVARLSLEAYRRSVGDPDARPQLDRSALRISRP